MMNDMMQYIDMYLDEAGELLTSIEDATLIIEKDYQDQEALNQLFRDFHTIKGSGAMYGLNPIVDFTHHLETMLDNVRQCKLTLNKSIVNIILESADYLKYLMDCYRNSAEIDEKVGRSILAKLNDLLEEKAETSESRIEFEATIVAPVKKDNIFHIAFTPDLDFFAGDMDPGLLLDELRSMGDCNIVCNHSLLPVFDAMDPTKCYLSWEIDLFTKYDINTVRYVFMFVEDSCNISITDIEDGVAPAGTASAEAFDNKVAALEQASSLLDHAKEKVQQAKVVKGFKTAEKSDSVRVLSEKLDRLINIVGELVITQAQLNQASSQIENNKLSSSVEDMERLTMELRDIVLNIRMVPIGNTFNKFHRLVRDLSGELQKDVELIIEGGDTELDKTIIERLDDCLVHLIRNSLDHGIESASERLKAGKAARATVRLTAQHMGDNVNITVEDDGGGIDPENIRTHALDKGLIDPKVYYSESELLNLIMLPGFSTSKKVSNISGRGVGMDVIKREIEGLHGSIKLSSKKGLCTITTLSLPLTMAIIEGLTVELGENRFVVPLSIVEECMDPHMAKKNTSENDLIMLRGEMIPVINLREVFRFQAEASEFQEIVIVKNADERVGILVDRVIGHQQTVIKPLGKVYKDAVGVSSATIIGDGTVALILDIPGIVKYALKDKEN